MANVRGFMDFERQEERHVPVAERILGFKEFNKNLTADEAVIQASRCMGCGVPFCSHGCPLHNMGADFNAAVSDKDFAGGYAFISQTNNFPEFTGRVCPALCEAACSDGLNGDACGIHSVERSIIDYAWSHGLVHPIPADSKTGKKVAIVGSGPSGLACAQQLARAGHDVTVYEKNDRIGGLMRYGIPDYKLPKDLIDRREEQMEAEGVKFVTSTVIAAQGQMPSGVRDESAKRIEPKELMANFDAVVLAGGSEHPRDLSVPGRELKGVYFALEYLIPQNHEVTDGKSNPINVKGKNVIVIGGGDTGNDCVGTAIRQGAAKVTQIELFPAPPKECNKQLVWPDWPRIARYSYAHEEGEVTGLLERVFSTNTLSLEGKDGVLKKINLIKSEIKDGRPCDVPGSEYSMDADFVFLAMGFVHPTSLTVDGFGVERDKRGNAAAAFDPDDGFATSVPGVFAAGDMRRGQSLVVWAIAEGRKCARAVDKFLMGETLLPR